MKKIISVILLAALLLSCCSCSTQKPAENAAQPQENLTEYEQNAIRMYGNIDQTTPVDGVYKIWNAEGVKNMYNHPDATFELLCNVYMHGATVPTLGTADQPFTGEIKGGNFTIFDFTIQGGAEGAFGFVAVNKGMIRNLQLSNVSFQVDNNAKDIGGLVGVNEGTVLQCSISGGQIDVSPVADQVNCGGLVGINTGTVNVNVAEVDIVCAVSGKANVGGIAGSTSGGSMQYNDCGGGLTFTGGTVTAGLFAGVAENVDFLGCKFLGPDNSVDGKLFFDFAGSESNVTYTDCLWRDNNATEPLPENVRNLRQKVVDKMYEMGTVEWSVTEVLTHNCKCGTSGVCVGSYNPMYTYIGMPYKHGSGSLTSFKYCLNEDGTFKDWLYDMDDFNGYDVYIGSMCVSATEMAWWTVSNSINHLECEFMLPDSQEYGCIPVGTGWWENATLSGTRYTKEYHDQTTQEVFFAALAEVRMGDCLVTRHQDGDHVIMASTDAAIVRDQEGNISGESFFLTHEQQGSNIIDSEKKTLTTWRLDYKRTFNSIWNAGKSGYIPVTMEELLTGEMEPVECTMLDSADGKLGMTVGTVKANYFLEAVTLKITDSKGQVVLDKIMFPKAGKPKDANTRLTSLSYIDSYNMANFCTPLQELQLIGGETYSYTVTATLATGDVIEVKADSFVNGTAG